MAHFAQLDENNIVLQVIVVNNDELMDENGAESEAKGASFCQSLFGVETVWKQTSYNGNFRYNYAGIGYSYDAERDAFIAPKPYPSWVLNETTCNWEAPVPYPVDGNSYMWHEGATGDPQFMSWVEVTYEV
jgi:hypothetical protein